MFAHGPGDYLGQIIVGTATVKGQAAFLLSVTIIAPHTRIRAPRQVILIGRGVGNVSSGDKLHSPPCLVDAGGANARTTAPGSQL